MGKSSGPERSTPERNLRRSFLWRLPWLLLACLLLYLCLAVLPDLITDRLYDLVWAAAES